MAFSVSEQLQIVYSDNSSEYNIKSMLKEKIGSSYYIAPEVLKRSYD